jgi:hypothetical protein
MLLSIKSPDVLKLRRHLEVYKASAFPFATKGTLNKLAFRTQQEARGLVGKQMILRNKWTRASIQVDKAYSNLVAHQEARVGSVEKYMDTQETGSSANRSKSSKKMQPIPTKGSTGEASLPRRKLPRGLNRRVNVRLAEKPIGANAKQRNAIAIAMAKKRGHKHVFLEHPGNKRGVYRMVRKKPVFILAYFKKTVPTPKNPWMRPAVAKVVPNTEKYFKQEIVRQIRKHRLFRN